MNKIIVTSKFLSPVFRLAGKVVCKALLGPPISAWGILTTE